jgi:YHS domain-containing protein
LFIKKGYKIMKKIKTILMSLVITVMASSSVFAVEENSLPAIGGYDPVSYFSANKAARGSGMNASEYKGQTYLFSSAKNKKAFDKNPTKYLPEFGGYCAFGAALGKKFHTDPTVFAIVDKKLYLNLNKDIQSKWNAKQSSMIMDAHKNWKKIKNKSAKTL